MDSAPLAPPVEPGAGRPLAVAVAKPEPAPFPAYVLLIGAAGVLLIGFAFGGFVLARRWPPVDPTDPVEAELQELIAEERVEQQRRVFDR